jgi:3-oxoacyl-[acyl-carrier protein] reductase
MVGTDRLLEIFEKSFKNRLSDIGMGRLAKPEEIANACVFLGSDLSEYVTGQILGVDGGTIL